jgi:hypothetical protein
LKLISIKEKNYIVVASGSFLSNGVCELVLPEKTAQLSMFLDQSKHTVADLEKELAKTSSASQKDGEAADKRVTK